MTAVRKTEITIETDRVVTIRHRSTRAWCPGCGCETDMVSLAEATLLSGIAGPALLDYAAARAWHVSEAPDGSGFICLESWLKSK